MRKDISTLLGTAELIAPEALAADNTPAAVDMRNYKAGVIGIHVGVGGITFDDTNKVEFKLTHSDDDSTYTAVTIADVTGIASVGTGGIVHSLIAAHAAAVLTKIGYHGGKRYLKLLADFSGTHGTATPMSAFVVQGEPLIAPV